MDLSELLQKAQQLTNKTKIDTELPHVERTISQVLQATQELHSRVTQAGTNDLQAYMLLGPKGVDVPRLTRSLESLSARKSFLPLNAINDTEVRGYLKNERENAILNVIEKSKQNILETVEQQKWHCTHVEWGKEKERLLNALVGPKQEDFPDTYLQRVPTVLHQEPLPCSRLTHIEYLFAQEITKYNQSYIESGSRFNLVSKFTKLVKDNCHDVLVHEMWCVLEYMANVTPLSSSVDPLKARQSAPQFVKQALDYLEGRYKEYMNKVVDQNKSLAMRGGVPSVYNLVNSYVAVTFSNPQNQIGLEDITRGKPLWPLVYFSLRSGDLGAAIRFLKEACIYSDLLNFLMQKQKADQEQLNAKMIGQLKLEYANLLQVSSDPYKNAVYALVVGCSANQSHPEIVRSIDDFLWLQLSVLRSDEQRDIDIEQLSYGGLQALILEKYGENYFNAREKAPIYYQVLVLTGQFESAIEFLARTETYKSHAVHMAIALNELCLLGAPSSVKKPLLSYEPDDPQPMRRLNLARLIILYAKPFELSNTPEALQYYYLLRHFKSPDGSNLMLTSVCDLLVENCGDSMLQLVFGKPVQPDSWVYTSGIFDNFPNIGYDKHTLAGMVGDGLVRRSQLELAIKLYFVANQLNDCLKIVSQLLCQVVHQTPRPGSMRTRLKGIVEKLNGAIANRPGDMEPHRLFTYTLLADLMNFFDYHHAGEHRAASEILAKHKLTPNSSNEVAECLIKLKRIGPEIVKVLPDVLLAAMEFVRMEYLDKRSSESNSNVRETCLLQLRDRAKALINMAASIPYRMPIDVNKKLVQMEILMH